MVFCWKKGFAWLSAIKTQGESGFEALRDQKGLRFLIQAGLFFPFHWDGVWGHGGGKAGSVGSVLRTTRGQGSL